MSDAPMLAGQASIWIQPDGPNTRPRYLGCHEIGDVDEGGLGDITNLYCPDPAAAGKFKVVGSFQGEPGTPTVTVTTDVYKTADYLETVKCPFTLFVHKLSCGRRDLFTNYDRSFMFRNARLTNRGLANLAVRSPDAEDRSTQTFDLGAEELLRVLSLNAARQDIAAVRNLLDVSFCNELACQGACGPAQGVCSHGVAVGASDYAAKGVLYITSDGGDTWTASAADPFAVAEDLSAVVCYAVSRSTTRILVARGTADGANPAEVAYSDDDGATWTTVNVGAVNGQYVPNANSLFALDQYHIWLGTNDGYIYVSDDGGVTWTAQEAAALNTHEWQAVFALNENVIWAGGYHNELAMSEDGGATWTAMTGPAGQATDDVMTIAVIDDYTIWLGYNDGKVFYSMDGGATWTQRTLPVTVTDVSQIVFYNSLVGYMAASGHVLRTIDGGYTWEDTTLPTTDPVNAIWVCGVNDAIAVGEVDGATALVLKIFA